jgi:tetratricopeptide (TPR) repeat protein
VDAAIALQPKEIVSFEVKALIFTKFKKFDQALDTLDRIRQLGADSMYILLQRARVQIQKADLKAALAELDQAYQLDAKNGDVLLLRAVVHQALGQKEQALADSAKVLELEPDSSTAVRLHAELLADFGKPAEAVAELEKYRLTQPHDTLALMHLASLYSGQQKYTEAIQCLADVLTVDPDQWMALRGRGDALLNLGKHAEAVADYNKAMKLHPKDPGILNNLAWVLATSPDEKVRDGKRAVAMATEACELTDYKLPHILSTLASAYAETGDFETAIKWSSKAVELGKDDEEKESLKKELESYHAHKPWRELLVAGKPQQD